MQIILNINKEIFKLRNFCRAGRNPLTGIFIPLGKSTQRFSLVLLLLCLLAAAATVSAQVKPTPTATPQTNPLSDWTRRGQNQMKDWLIRSAEKMSESDYNFKPTEAVRSYGEIVGHIADMQYNFCSVVLGEKNPDLKIEKTKTTKVELIAALKESYAYCDKAYNDLTDATAAQMVKHNGANLPKLFLLNTNISHAALHYGNLITYMRLKNIVPPSSER